MQQTIISKTNFDYKIMNRLFTTLVTLICASTVFAQFSLDGQFLPRTELRNGFKKPILQGQDPAIFTEHRARIIAGYKMEKLGFKFSLQDVRIWGETGQINKSDQLLSVHEAYGDYYASKQSTIRVGRQEVIYDDHRLFGNLDWAAQGRALDAVRYLYKDTKGNQFDLMGSWNQNGYGDGSPEPLKLTGNNYGNTTLGNGNNTNTRIFNLGLPKAQLMAYYKKTLKSGDIAIMLLNDVSNANTISNTITKINDSTLTYSDFTVGITPNFKFGKLKVGGQFYYTAGSAGKTYTGTAGYKDIELGGFMASAFVQHTGVIGAPLLGADYLTGDDEKTAKVEGWNPKYGTNHKFYGYMDYFYVGNGHGGVNEKSAGLLDVYLKTTFKLAEKTILMGDLHYFASTANRTNKTTNIVYSGTLGTELDLVFVHTLAKNIVLKGGYSQMFGSSKTMKQLKFGNPDQKIQGMQSWGWIMVAFTPKFL